MATMATLAAAAESWFVRKTRDSGAPFETLKDGRPQWLVDLVHEAHAGLLPDDWKYACIRSALDHIGESEAETRGDAMDDASAFADNEVDVYTSARYEWLSSNLSRSGYVDEATETFGAASDVVESIGRGQYLEAEEVYGLVCQSLETRLEELNELIERETVAYLECALWAGTFTRRRGLVDVTESLDTAYSIDDVSDDSRAEVVELIERFYLANESDADQLAEGMLGHDLHLTRNGHGAGFWDRGLGDVGDRLAEAARALGELELYVADGGTLELA